MHQFADNASSYVQDVEESVKGYIKEYRQGIQERDYYKYIMILSFSLWKEKKFLNDEYYSNYLFITAIFWNRFSWLF